VKKRRTQRIDREQVAAWLRDNIDLNRQRAAKRLGIAEQTLREIEREFGVERPDSAAPKPMSGVNADAQAWYLRPPMDDPPR